VVKYEIIKLRTRFISEEFDPFIAAAAHIHLFFFHAWLFIRNLSSIICQKEETIRQPHRKFMGKVL